MTYVGRDELTGESLSPSSVVLELRETLKRGYVPEPLNRQYPRRRYDDPRTGRFLPAAKREASARALGESLRMHLGRSHLPPLSKLDLPDGVREALGLLAPPASSPGVVDRGTVSLSALRQFLECPLQGSARFVLRLREDDADLLAREDEVFRASASDRARLLRLAFRDGGTARPMTRRPTGSSSREAAPREPSVTRSGSCISRYWNPGAPRSARSSGIRKSSF